MTVSEAILIGLFCMTLVFTILAVLYVLIRLFTAAIQSFEKAQTKQNNQK